MNACENHDVLVERNGADHDDISLELFRGQPEMERILRRAMKLFLPNQKEG